MSLPRKSPSHHQQLAFLCLAAPHQSFLCVRWKLEVCYHYLLSVCLPTSNSVLLQCETHPIQCSCNMKHTHTAPISISATAAKATLVSLPRPQFFWVYNVNSPAMYTVHSRWIGSYKHHQTPFPPSAACQSSTAKPGGTSGNPGDNWTQTASQSDLCLAKPFGTFLNPQGDRLTRSITIDRQTHL